MGRTAQALWRDFYEVVNNLNNLAPWDFAQGEDLFTIVLPNQEEPLFCSVLGAAGDCYGVAMYQGAAGLHDFQRILEQGTSIESPQYVMRDQTCFTLYWGDREEVPPDQKAMIKTLGLKYRGRGKWPYLLKMKSRYVPVSPELSQLALVVECLKNLSMMALALRQGCLKPDWDGCTMLLREYAPKQKEWQTSWHPLVIVSATLEPIILEDKLLLHRLKTTKSNGHEVCIDLCYLDSMVKEKGQAPFYPMVLVIFDKTADQILELELCAPEDHLGEIIVNGFIECVLSHGKMRRVKARNPYVIAALKETCNHCGTFLKEVALPEIDAILDDLSEM